MFQFSTGLSKVIVLDWEFRKILSVLLSKLFKMSVMLGLQGYLWGVEKMENMDHSLVAFRQDRVSLSIFDFESCEQHSHQSTSHT